MKSEGQKSRVNKINPSHNMSMYEKFGVGGLSGSPDRNMINQASYQPGL